ncbi:ATP-binding protein [Amycolatopsis sp. QT-25]|uniref:ATP-binding protein n=1 Tax=Amycolatopsis sp. QT-25 TaxID=3034022 RepID=UPI0023EBC837|nr:ATP-binding protein [Amycolatopsis sp. QT-25]WET76839.1 ATP-binding protein [Amycolatopsis sp. QT-25]
MTTVDGGGTRMSKNPDSADDGVDSSFPVDIDFEVDQLTQRVSRAAEVNLRLSKRPEQRRVHSTVANCLAFGRAGNEPLGAILSVVDELVSNAYRHTATPGELRIIRKTDDMLIEVTDSDPDVEWMTASTDEASRSGHGLRLVTHLSLDWGVSPEGSGKVVWALVPAQLYFER